MPKIKCTERDVEKIVRRAIEEGKPVRSKEELVDMLKKHCRYEVESSAYRLVKKLEERGFLRYVRGYGYIITSAGREHDELILRTCALLLDVVKPTMKPVHEILKEGFSRYYGEELPGVVVLQLVERVLEHVITSEDGWDKRIEGVAGIIENLGKLEEQLNLLQRERRELTIANGNRCKTDFLEEVAKVLEIQEESRSMQEAYCRTLLDSIIPDIVKKRGDIKEACYEWARAGALAEEARPIIKRFCDKIEILSKEAPITSTIVEIERRMYELSLEKERMEADARKWYEKLIDSIEAFYVNSRIWTPGILNGWCEMCRRGFANEKLKIVVKGFIKMIVLEKLKLIADLKRIDELWRVRPPSYY
jgi:DNA-binding transcriptional regulator YhcF (GntR family)